MSQYFVLANSNKREYFGPGDFGEELSGYCFPQGGYMHIHGLALLVCRTDNILGSPNRWGTLAGAWAGDTVVAVGDEASAEEHDMVMMEYGNIGHKVLIMLCEGDLVCDDEDDFIPTIVRASKDGGKSSLLRTLGCAALVAGYKPLEEELHRQWGPGWVAKYHEEMESWGKFYRLG